MLSQIIYLQVKEAKCVVLDDFLRHILRVVLEPEPTSKRKLLIFFTTTHNIVAECWGSHVQEKIRTYTEHNECLDDETVCFLFVIRH